MSRDAARKVLGNYVKPPGTENLHSATVPSVDSIYGNPPVIDSTLVSEETITYSIVAVPHIQESDGGARADELLTPGDLLFGTRTDTDPRVGVFEWAHLNILLHDRMLEYQNLLGRKISAILHDLEKGGKHEILEKYDLSKIEGMSLKQYMDLNNFYPNDFLAGGKSNTTILPSQLGLFLMTADNGQIKKADRQKFQIPEIAIRPGQNEGLLESLYFLAEKTEMSDSPDDQSFLKYKMKKERNRLKAREVIYQILSGFPEIMTYVTAEGIMSKFSYLGAMVSSQDDTDVQTISARGQQRNINLAMRGPIEITNRWADDMVKGTYMYLILKRIKTRDDAWGPFAFIPYWSVVDEKDTHYGTSSSIGPVTGRPARSRIIPQKELTYKDLSGRDAIGHPIYIGFTRYMTKASVQTRGKIPSSVALSAQRAVSLGLAVADERSRNLVQTSLRQAVNEKSKLPQIYVYLGI